MMSDSSSYMSGSRAIKIPHQSGDAADTPARIRHRSYQHLERADASDAGASSSVSSDRDSSSWSSYAHSSDGNNPHRAQQATASPSNTDSHLACMTTPSNDKSRKDKHRASSSPSSPPTSGSFSRTSSSPLGPSMLESSSYKSVNLNSRYDDPDEPQRLICYTKHSQGFTWNDELFLPSYLLGRYGGGGRGRRREHDADFGDEEQCPVAEIFVTDEEAQAMMP